MASAAEFPTGCRTARRCSVSAEPMNPETDFIEHQKVVIYKSDEAKQRIELATKTNLLFRNLDHEQHQDVCNAMFERQVKEGDVIIQQGDEGDNFYVVDQGIFDVFVAKPGEESKKVTTIGERGSFGELALLYNAPRAATVVATTDGILWAVDRVSFRRIVMAITAKKRRMYEGFLHIVPLLQDLTTHERSKIADALDPIEFEDGSTIIKQGDSHSECFYIIEEGTVVVQKDMGDGLPPKEVLRVQRGGYFGEIALLTEKPRAATVLAEGNVKCVALDRASFVRLMGPCDEILKRNMENYARYESEM